VGSIADLFAGVDSTYVHVYIAVFRWLAPVLAVLLILRCAKRGMGIWIVSSGISEIREKSGSRDFLDRLRYLD